MNVISRKSLIGAAVLAAAFVAGAFWAVRELWPYTGLRGMAVELQRAGRPAIVRRALVTDLGTLELTSFSVASRVPIRRTGGGIDAIGNDVLVMGFRGEFYLYRNADPERSLVPLNIALENGYDRYLQHVADGDLKFPNADTYFRFIDVVYDDTGSSPALWVSHHQWHADEACYTVRLSKLMLSAGTPLERQSAVPADWQKVYDTAPCLPLDASAPVFNGHLSGGRLVVVGPDAVLMSVGDHGFDGWNHQRMLSQDPANDYGKIILVQAGSGMVSHVSAGHRNPQGLMVSSDGLIWSTEHGPRGGDELNLIADGGNYGWPYVTYGAEYGMSRWPISDSQNRHDGYVRPVFAWIPSIGISGIIQVSRFLPEWEGDLLIASLERKALHRVRYAEGRVIFDEAIVIGERIRDLDQLEDGTIVMWTNDAALMELRPGRSVEPDLESIVAELPDTARRQVVSTIGACLQCHDASPGAEAAAAPNLWGVFGRRIAGTDFAAYSDALRRRSGRWNESTLDAFLADVQGFSAGSTMGFSGIPDGQVRSAVIVYLQALREDAGAGP